MKTYVSMRIAQQSERWSITNTSEQSRATIHVDPVAAERKFRDELRYDEDSKLHFANRRSIHISYEDMTRHYDRTLGDVQDFLGVERRPLKPTIVKQEVRSLRDVISNFSQLEEAWKGTEWQAYLEDDPPDPKVGSVLRS